MKTALLISTFALGVTAGGCAENDVSLIITRFVKLDPTMMCVADPMSTVNTDYGVLDTTIVSAYAASANTFGYVAAPVVQNNLTERATATTTERDLIQISGFDVQLQARPGGPPPPVSLSKFFVNAAAGAAVPAQGKVAALAELLPAARALELDSSGFHDIVIAHVRPVGIHTGSTITGAWVDFPIRICQGCLANIAQKCPMAGYKSGEIDKGGCYYAQDYPITCCIRSDMVTVCGKYVPTM